MNSTELHELTGMAVLVSWITMVTCVYGVVSLFVLLMLMMLGGDVEVCYRVDGVVVGGALHSHDRVWCCACV